MKSFKLVGLTGTTGAGKGEVSKIFAENGYKVIYADSLAREIMNNPLALGCLRMSFGGDIAPNDILNRQLLADRAFKNPETKRLLDSVTHPFISSLFMSELKRLKALGADRILFDAPQLFESGLDVVCDIIISVISDRELRLKRIARRDGISEVQAKARVGVQLSDDYFRENSDYVIENNSEFDTLKQEVLKIIKISEVRFGSDKKA